MNNIGFSDLEEVIYETDYKGFQKYAFFSLTTRARKLRAVDILEGTKPEALQPIEKYKQQVFLNFYNTKGYEQ